eukprot:SAG22_NODE_336_length_12071_cov_10.875125_10_plen_149_part_00
MFILATPQDNLERLLGYVPIGPRFSNEILQTLLVLLKKIPPKGRKLLILASATSLGILESMDLKSAFEVLVPVPLLEATEISAVLQQTKAFDPAEMETCAGLFTDGIGNILSVAAPARPNPDKHSSLCQPIETNPWLLTSVSQESRSC